jgi:hypothetical protein
MTVERIVYQIVKIGGAPGEISFPDEGATCAEWSLSKDKARKEVITFDLVTKQVTRRYSTVEAERIAANWRSH